MDWEAFKRYLDENGISQSEAAERLGIKRQYLNDVLHGKRKPKVEFEDKVNAIFGLKPETIQEADVINEYIGGLEKRIRGSIKELPKDIDEFAELMIGSWRVGVKDTLKLVNHWE